LRKFEVFTEQKEEFIYLKYKRIIMKGISAIIVAILILLIGISMTGLGYVTFTSLFSKLTTSSEQVISTTVTAMLAQVKIESIDITGNKINIRNIGKVDLTKFTVYINDAAVTSFTPPGGAGVDKIQPGQVLYISNIVPALTAGKIIKVTTAEGAIAMQSA
jgi:archaellum component FlaF (FlaF/FlaG flagellin family)